MVALGLEALGRPLVPDFAKGLPSEKWSHSIDPLDCGRQAGSAWTWWAVAQQLATGFRLDWALHPEFANFSGEVKAWADTFTPPHGTGLPELDATPYLSNTFQFPAKVPGRCPGLEQIYCFCFPSTLSNGHVTALIPGVSMGAKRLAEGLASSLYNEDREILYQRILDLDDPEVLGEEWQPE